MSEVWCVRAGIVPYERARSAQRAIADARHAADVPDVLLLLEHPPVYTRGRRSDPSELPMDEAWYRSRGIEVCETDRGGRVTYHGPGQLVGYPIIGLRSYSDGVHGYVRRLERVMTASLHEWDVETQVFDGLTGLWTMGGSPIPLGAIGPQGTAVAKRNAHQPEPSDEQARKIGAIGVHVRRGITSHGFAINVNNDLAPFEWIVPCGIEACTATSITHETDAGRDLGGFSTTVAERFSSAFSRRTVSLEPGELAERVAGIDGLLGEPGGGDPVRSRDIHSEAAAPPGAR